jgi:uncharacterized protein
MNKYFLDSYALIEIIEGNPSYKKYLDYDLFTNIFNLYELYFALLRKGLGEKSKDYFFRFKEIIVEIGDDHIFEASDFKLSNKKKKFSYADCLGYVMAFSNSAKFLTGDNGFEGFENVEFVK